MKWTFERVVEKNIMHACVTLQAQAMVRCKGITKAGNQCSVTSSSSWVDDTGRLVAAPLCRGGDFCVLRAKPFCVKPILLDNFESMVVSCRLNLKKKQQYPASGCPRTYHCKSLSLPHAPSSNCIFRKVAIYCFGGSSCIVVCKRIQ